MMDAVEFRLSGLLPLRNSAPTFATPLFTRSDSNKEFIQNVDRDLNFLGMVPAELPRRPRPFRDVFNARINLDGRAHLAFLAAGTPYIVGRIDDISDRLRRAARDIPNYPFVQRSVARLLKDRVLEAEAQNRIAHRRRLVLDKSFNTSEIKTVSLESRVFRLTRYYRTPESLSLVETDEELKLLTELEERTSNRLYRGGNSFESFQSEPDQRRQLLAMLRAIFTYGSPTGTRFASPNALAFYGAQSLRGAVAEVGWHYSTQATSLGIRQSEAVTFQATEWMVRGDLADLRDLQVERSSWLRSQEIGDALREANYEGVLFRSPYSDEHGFCLFKPKLILGGRIIGRLVLQFESDGGVSYDLED